MSKEAVALRALLGVKGGSLIDLRNAYYAGIRSGSIKLGDDVTVVNNNTTVMPSTPAPATVKSLWSHSDNALTTLPRGNLVDSNASASTPASGVLHLTSFRAERDMTVAKIKFLTGNLLPITATAARVGLYAVNADGTYTLLSANSGTSPALSGLFTAQSYTLATPTAVTAGGLYAVGIIQIALTTASVLGHWFRASELGASPAIAVTKSGFTTLPTSVSGTSLSNFPVYYELSA